MSVNKSLFFAATVKGRKTKHWAPSPLTLAGGAEVRELDGLGCIMPATRLEEWDQICRNGCQVGRTDELIESI